MLYKIFFLFTISSFSVQASMFGEENAALWKIVGLETKSLAEITSLLDIQSRHVEAVLDAYDNADQKIEKGEYIKYLLDRSINIKDELDREKSISSIRNNIRVFKGIGGDYIDTLELSNLENEILDAQKARNSKSKGRQKEVDKEARNLGKSNNSLLNTHERSARINLHTAETVEDILKEQRSSHLLTIAYSRKKRLEELKKRYDFLMFLGAYPANYTFKKYLSDLNTMSQL